MNELVQNSTFSKQHGIYNAELLLITRQSTQTNISINIYVAMVKKTGVHSCRGAYLHVYAPSLTSISLRGISSKAGHLLIVREW